MGRDYPINSGGYPNFRRNLKLAFEKTKIESEADLTQALKKGDFVIKELEALYFLARYRDMKRKYS